MKSPTIIYLYAELMGYQIPVFKELVKIHGAKLHVVHWDHKKLTPYVPPQLENVTYYKRSLFTKQKLIELTNEIKPDLVYVSGWMDNDYLKAARYLRKKNIPVVAGSDTQWKGNLKQHIATIIFPFTIKKCFSHIWVAGPYQYEYARKLGFNKNEIIFNTLSADTLLFSKAKYFLKEKKIKYPKAFLYVGNFRAVKGTDILIKAFNIYRNKYKGDWKLICVGNGEMENLLENIPFIEKHKFKRQEDLVKLTKKAGAFVLPSRFDQWGLVVHEFASAGLPLILSENVGAASTFLIENFNGLQFRNNSSNKLAMALHIISQKDKTELIKMGENSFLLSQRINPEIVASSLMSVV